MSKHLQRDIDLIRRELLAQFGLVEKVIDDAVRSLTEHRGDLYETVLGGDQAIDDREVLIEEQCLKTLALHQPVAADLRWITTVIKINSDLERIADLACNIAERARDLHHTPHFPIPGQVPLMVADALQMVRDALDAFVDLDLHKAREVIRMDVSVDRQNVEVINVLVEIMSNKPDMVAAALHCFSAARHIERIADLAENIAEDVIYIIEGEIIRHRNHENSTSNYS